MSTHLDHAGRAVKDIRWGVRVNENNLETPDATVNSLEQGFPSSLHQVDAFIQSDTAFPYY